MDRLSKGHLSFFEGFLLDGRTVCIDSHNLAYSTSPHSQDLLSNKRDLRDSRDLRDIRDALSLMSF